MNKQTEKLIKECKVSQLQKKATSLIDLEFFIKRLESLDEKALRKELAEQNESKVTVIEDNRDEEKIKKINDNIRSINESINKEEDNEVKENLKKDLFNENIKRQDEEAKLKTEDKSDPIRIDAIEKSLARVATCKVEIDRYKTIIADIDFYLEKLEDLDKDIINQLDEFPKIIYDNCCCSTNVGQDKTR